MSPQPPGPNLNSSEHPEPGSQASGPGLDLDLAFSSDDDLGDALLNQAGPLADPLAGAELWHDQLGRWLDDLQAELPEALRSGAYCLGLQLVSDASIAELNLDWRGKSGATDVLAFAAQDADLSGAPLMPLPPQFEQDGENGPEGDEDEVADEVANEGDDEGDDESDGDDGSEAQGGESDGDQDQDGDEDGDKFGDSDDVNDSDEGWGPAFEALELGDIVISLDTAARQAPEHGHSLEQELLFLASHGLLHLLGWDHPDDASLAAMLARQERLLAAAPLRP